MSDPPPAGDLACLRSLFPAWVIVPHGDWYAARRAYWGNQLIITAPTLGELTARLQALPADQAL